jgi:ubiquitin carboxyl-terminal hydrolase 5/13
MTGLDQDIEELAFFKPPILSQSVHREECTQCFDSQVLALKIHIVTSIHACPQDDLLGVDVCLTCFNGGCLSTERNHAYMHYKKTGHAFSLNVKRRPRPQPNPNKRVSPHSYR